MPGEAASGGALHNSLAKLLRDAHGVLVRAAVRCTHMSVPAAATDQRGTQTNGQKGLPVRAD